MGVEEKTDVEEKTGVAGGSVDVVVIGGVTAK